MKSKFFVSLKNDFLVKSSLYCSHFFQIAPSKPWFFRLSLSRDQIVTLCRVRSNHYNLNYSLHRKNIVASSACLCGDPHQDVNHVIFRCPLTRNKSRNLLLHLFRRNPQNNLNLFPFLKKPSPKLCRLLISFFKSNGPSHLALNLPLLCFFPFFAPRSPSRLAFRSRSLLHIRAPASCSRLDDFSGNFQYQDS